MYHVYIYYKSELRLNAHANICRMYILAKNIQNIQETYDCEQANVMD